MPISACVNRMNQLRWRMTDRAERCSGAHADGAAAVGSGPADTSHSIDGCRYGRKPGRDGFSAGTRFAVAGDRVFDARAVPGLRARWCSSKTA